MNSFKTYKPRKVEFNRLVAANDWHVKVYTITCKSEFKSATVLDNAIINLPEWLEKSKTLDFETYRTAFLVVHEGLDGVWSLLNWWTGGEMLRSLTFYTNFNNLDTFQQLPKEGFMACVWEMAVINFERSTWIEHILKKAEQPDFKGYFEKFLSRKV